jgi:hypothetical protein
MKTPLLKKLFAKENKIIENFLFKRHNLEKNHQYYEMMILVKYFE